MSDREHQERREILRLLRETDRRLRRLELLCEAILAQDEGSPPTVPPIAAITVVPVA